MKKLLKFIDKCFDKHPYLTLFLIIFLGLMVIISMVAILVLLGMMGQYVLAAIYFSFMIAILVVFFVAISDDDNY